VSGFFIEFEDGMYVNAEDIKLLMVFDANVRFRLNDQWSSVCPNHANTFLNNFQTFDSNAQKFQAIYAKQLFEKNKLKAVQSND
jgi:hypothetical protein